MLLTFFKKKYIILILNVTAYISGVKNEKDFRQPIFAIGTTAISLLVQLIERKGKRTTKSRTAYSVDNTKVFRRNKNINKDNS